MTLHYRLFQDSDGDAIAGLLADVFPRRDPLAVAAQITSAEFAAFVQTLLPQVSNEGLTIVGCHAETGEVAAVMLTTDAAKDSPEKLLEVSEKFAPVAGILGDLDDLYFAGRAPHPGEMLHLFLLGVSDRAAGQGVGQQLVMRALENGARKGYRVAHAEATNKTSQHIFGKLGFAERAKIPYGDYLFHGQRVFAGIAEHGGPILMEMVLTGTEFSPEKHPA